MVNGGRENQSARKPNGETEENKRRAEAKKCPAQAKQMSSPSEKMVYLYGELTAPCTTMVVAYLKKKNINFRVLDVKRKPDFLALESFGKVPVVRDGVHTLFGSRDIIVHYASKYGKIMKDAELKKWLESEQKLNSLLFDFVMTNRPPAEKRTSEERKKLEKELDEYENHLARNSTSYLTGKSCSFVDLTQLSTINSILKACPDGSLLKNRGLVKEWWKNVSSGTLPQAFEDF